DRQVAPSIPDVLPSCPAAATTPNQSSRRSATAGRQAVSSTNDENGKLRAARRQGAQEVFPDPQRPSAKDDRLREGGGRCELLPQSRRDAVARRRERVRKDHDVPLYPARYHPDGRSGHPCRE